MKRRQKLLNNASLIIALAALLGVLGMMTGWAQAGPRLQAGGAPEMISYQGQVMISDQPYDGTGYFKFAIVDSAGTTTYWSNDNTSGGGGEPTAAISLPVTNGLFSLLLGDTGLTGMSQTLDDSAFSDPDTYLRVWFSEDDSTYTQMPDQKIAAVPYALQAEAALDADMLDGVQGSGYQLQITGSCAPGTSIRAINGDGSVACEMHDPFPVHLSQDINISSYLNNVVIGSNGLPLIISIAGHQIDSIACHDPACTQYTHSSSVPLSGVIFSNGSLEMAVGTDGLVVFVIVDSAGGDIYLGHCDDLVCSTFTLAWLNDVSSVSKADLVITPVGLPLIVASASTSTDLEAYFCDDPLCTSNAPPTLIDNSINLGHHVTMTADGLPLIAYVSSNTLTTYKCMDVACSTPGIKTVHSNQVGQPGTPEIATADNGVGMMVMRMTGYIEYGLCQDINCTSVIFNTIRLRVNGDFEDYVSIVKGDDQLPLITYQDSKAGFEGLYIAHCGNRACSGVTHNQIVAGEYGEISELTIGMDGMPFVTYGWRDDLSSPTTLFSMHCSNEFCTPYWRGW